MAEGDAQLRMPRGDAAGDHRCRGERDVARKAHRLLGEGADDAVLPRGAQRVHEDRRAGFFGGGEERLEARIADGNAVDVAGDFDPGKVQFLQDEIQFKNCTVHVLQRHRAQADEALRRERDHFRDLLVQVADQRLGVLERQPVGEQLRHRRERLPRDAHRAHVLDAARHAPAAVGHCPVDLAGNHHVLVAGVRLGHRGPGHVAPLARVGGKALGDDVVVDVDAVGRSWMRPWENSVVEFGEHQVVLGQRPGTHHDALAVEHRRDAAHRRFLQFQLRMPPRPARRAAGRAAG